MFAFLCRLVVIAIEAIVGVFAAEFARDQYDKRYRHA